MRFQGGRTSAFLLGLSFLALGCEGAPEGWTPVLEETSTGFLVTEVERLMDHVQSALLNLATDPDGSAADLRDAESTLDHLLDYYLPLLQARERAYNAYRLHFLGEDGAVADELSRIGDLLTDMAVEAEGPRLLEIESLAEALADAEMATASGASQGRESLEGLARRLNQAALKGDLILRR